MLCKRQLLSIILLGFLSLNSSDASEVLPESESNLEASQNNHTAREPMIDVPEVDTSVSEGMKIVLTMTQQSIKNMQLHKSPNWKCVNKSIHEEQTNQHIARLNSLVSKILENKKHLRENSEAQIIRINFQNKFFICDALGIFQESLKGILGYMMLKPHDYHFRSPSYLKKLEADFIYVQKMQGYGKSLFGDMPDLEVVEIYAAKALDILKLHAPVLDDFEKTRNAYHIACSKYGTQMSNERVEEFQSQTNEYYLFVKETLNKFQKIFEAYRQAL